MSNATDLTPRSNIVDAYRQRIAEGSRYKLSRDDFEALVQHFIADIASLRGEAVIRDRCLQEIALLEEGYSPSSVAKNRLGYYRNAIQEAVSEGTLPMVEGETCASQVQHPDAHTEYTFTAHYAHVYMVYSDALYREFNAKTARKNNLHQDALKPVALKPYLDTLDALLDSDAFEDWAIAIAGITGRRFSEIIARGRFELVPGATYQIRFAGQLKKRDEDELKIQYSVLTLLPAMRVIDCWERLREHPEVKALQGADPRTINVKLNLRINRRIRVVLQDAGVVPVLDHEKGVTVHNLRGIYGEIATHFFCPPSQHPHRFAQQQLGHVIRKQDLETKANSTATTHYFHYFLVDEDGRQMGDRGVRLVDGDTASGAVTKATTVERADRADYFGELESLKATVMQLVKGFQEMQRGASLSTESDSDVEPVIQPEIETAADVDTGPDADSEPEAIREGAPVFGGIQDGLDDVLEELQALHEEIATANQLAAQQRETIIHLLKQQVEADAQEAVGEALAKISQDILGASQNHRVLGGSKQSLATSAPRRQPKPKSDVVDSEDAGKQLSGVDESFREVPSDELKQMNNRGVAQEKLRRAFEAIRAYNDAPERTQQQKWRINQSILHQFTGCNIPAARDFKKAYADEIKAHNTQHQLSPRHNLNHSRNNEDINDFIQW